MAIKKVDIRPGVSVLSVLRHLNYKPWFALAEFVDNAVQSFQANRDALIKLHGEKVKLRVSIELQDSPAPRFVIRDTAAGISAEDYPRAFRPAALPTDRSGLSEFGIGMKSAACWFSPQWSVRTKALGETVERTIEFDINRIVNDDISELFIQERPAKSEEHFTEVILSDLHRKPAGRTIGKIKEHLADIYRVFIRDQTLDLFFDGQPLRYDSPPVLEASYFRTPEQPAKKWLKEIKFDFGGELSVYGFAAIRATASTSRAGLALFRRGRLIQGSGDEGYRPDAIFGNSNSYRYQRLFGELHLYGFDVSHTKDGFRWDENEEPFLDLLREHLDDGETPLLKQAEGYRVRQNREQLARAANEALASAANALETGLKEALEHIDASPTTDTAPPTSLPQIAEPLASRTIATRFRGQAWQITFELTNDIGPDWIQISDKPSAAASSEPRKLGLRVSMAHPFMVRFSGTGAENIDPFLRLAASLGIAEVLTRESGYKGSSVFLQNVNDIIGEAMSQP